MNQFIHYPYLTTYATTYLSFGLARPRGEIILSSSPHTSQPLALRTSERFLSVSHASILHLLRPDYRFLRLWSCVDRPWLDIYHSSSSLITPPSLSTPSGFKLGHNTCGVFGLKGAICFFLATPASSYICSPKLMSPHA